MFNSYKINTLSIAASRVHTAAKIAQPHVIRAASVVASETAQISRKYTPLVKQTIFFAGSILFERAVPLSAKIASAGFQMGGSATVAAARWSISQLSSNKLLSSQNETMSSANNFFKGFAITAVNIVVSSLRSAMTGLCAWINRRDDEPVIKSVSVEDIEKELEDQRSKNAELVEMLAQRESRVSELTMALDVESNSTKALVEEKQRLQEALDAAMARVAAIASVPASDSEVKAEDSHYVAEEPIVMMMVPPPPAPPVAGLLNRRPAFTRSPAQAKKNAEKNNSAVSVAQALSIAEILQARFRAFNGDENDTEEEDEGSFE